MLKSTKTITMALAAIAVSGLALSPASARERIRVGTLNCAVEPGVGWLVVSQKQVNCIFNPSYRGGPREHYRGTINKAGVDLGFTTGGALAWAVYAPTSRRYGALAGNYGGVTAEATVGVGAGANALIGGSNRTITLQPLSVQGQGGLNLAAGVAGLELHPARR